MFVVLTYDVAAKRNRRVLKVCRKYLIHVQKSVFEGEINTWRLESLKNQLEKLIDPKKDKVTIYKFSKVVRKEEIGLATITDNII